MRFFLGNLRRRDGQGYLEGFLVVWIMMIFIISIYAVGSAIWARTFTHTTTALAAQQALVAYDRNAFNRNAVGDTSSSEARGREEARRAANTVFDSVTAPSANSGQGAYDALKLEPNGCGSSGSGPWSSQVAVDSSSSGLVTVSVSSNARWRMGGFYATCLPTERTITGDKR